MFEIFTIAAFILLAYGISVIMERQNSLARNQKKIYSLLEKIYERQNK